MWVIRAHLWICPGQSTENWESGCAEDCEEGSGDLGTRVGGGSTGDFGIVKEWSALEVVVPRAGRRMVRSLRRNGTEATVNESLESPKKRVARGERAVVPS